MLPCLEDQLLRKIFGWLAVPTFLWCLMDTYPSPPIIASLAQRGNEMNRELQESGGFCHPMDHGVLCYASAFPSLLFAALAPAQSALARRLPLVLQEVGSLVPFIPRWPQVTVDHTEQGTEIRMRLRDILLVEWRRLGSRQVF